MKVLLFIVIVALTISCRVKSDAWQTLDFGAFTLKTPKGWSIVKAQGIDSYVGGLTNGKDTLSFDYGWYTAEIDDAEQERHLYAQDTINGLTAVLQIPKVDGQGLLVMFIPKVSGSNKFGIAGRNIKGTDTVLNIFKSIRFNQSDTTRNGVLNISKFKEFPFGSGRTLYYGFCSPCHSLNRTNYTGPPLNEALKGKGTEELLTFLQARKPQKRNDSVINTEHQKIEWFDTLTKNDVQQIIGYVRGQ